MDLIHGDISLKESIQRLKNQPLDENKPGLGQYYCIECAKYFEAQPTLDRHTKSKIHKRRVKDLKQRPYTNLESEAANGLNMARFMESVEKYKQLEGYKKEHEAELEELKRQKNSKLDSIITGIPEEELAGDAAASTNDAMTD